MKSAIKSADNRHEMTMPPDRSLYDIAKYILILATVSTSAVLTQSAEPNRTKSTTAEIQGTIRYQSFLPNGELFADSPCDFAFNISNCLWSVKLVNHAEDSDYKQVSYDGENLYCLVVLETGFKKLIEKDRSEGKVPNSDANTAIGVAAKGQIPYFIAAHEVTPLWLTFGSRCNMERASPGSLFAGSTLNVWSGMDLNSYSQYSLKADWTLDEGGSGLPASVVYYDDGLLVDVTDERLPSSPRFPSPYNYGFTNSIFQAFDFQTYGSLRIPKRAEYTTYFIKNGGSSSNDLRILTRYEIIVTNVTKAALPELIPKYIGRTYYSDSRLARFNPPIPELVYFTPGKFLTDQELLSSETYAREILARRGSSVEGGTRRGTVLGIGAATILVGGVLLLLTAVKLQRRNKQT